MAKRTDLSQSMFNKSMQLAEKEAQKRADGGYNDAYVTVPDVCVGKVKEELTINGYSITMHDSHDTTIHFTW